MTNNRARKNWIFTRFGKFLCHFESNAPERGYTITCPEAQGFVAYGKDLSTAKRTAREGLEFHCECLALERVMGGGKKIAGRGKAISRV